ncbi:MAG TPA: methyltransferase domain-containing protein [Alphaproteobacteria bacterium]|nr:methyltransferase domain-containing protein [Alphaproteobacteria bacterium]
MPDPRTVSRHYTHGALLDAIRDGVAKLGKSPSGVTLEELGAADEFHIGGRIATARFLEKLGITANDQVLDVGCGFGGASRFAAEAFGCAVTGIDLTEEYIAAGREINGWVGLSGRVTLENGNATSLPYEDGAFDKVYMLHVGMNVEDKDKMASEMFRVLRPGGRAGVYDIMQMNGDPLLFPVPWAASAAGSVVESPAVYKQALAKAGFHLTHEEIRKQFAIEFFDKLRASVSEAGGPPPLSLQLVMRDDAPKKIKNMVENIKAGRIAPVELIAEKPA